ncbi:MAG: hypothetical protein IJT69_00695 [Clostridia bacterium]|nr:hypothetical protein [Clostridia bacterium]
MAKVEYVKDYAGRILRIHEYAPNGDITVRGFSSRLILGYYRASRDVTTDFSGRVLYRGNAIGMLK